VARHRRDRGPLGIRARDPYTLVLTLRTPDDALLEKLAQPRYAVPTAPPERELRAGHALATGAYRLAAADSGGFVLTRNPQYRGSAPGRLDTIRVRTGVSARRAALGLTSGAVGLVWPAPLEYRTRFLRDADLAHAEGDETAAPAWMLVLNCELAPTARQQARQAVARAVNRQRVVGLLLPLAAPWRGFVPDGPGSASAPGFDPAAAEAALESARLGRGIQLPVQVPRGTLEGATARGLVSDFGRAGVYGEVVGKPRPAYLRSLYARRGAVASLATWRAPTSDPLSNLAELLLNRSLDERWGGNLCSYRAAGSAALDSLLLRGLAERTAAARALALSEIELRLADDLPFVPIARVQEQAFFRREVRGVRFHPRYGLDLARIRLALSEKD
jgi:ABC-type transport system substrate-binding protein